ncbi:hypothetical protein HY988_06375 [Candidatus Micrarchaeota archaeon]|nr:hypothetical protein [Candidatus Micrarchaeota archaeon]
MTGIVADKSGVLTVNCTAQNFPTKIKVNATDDDSAIREKIIKALNSAYRDAGDGGDEKSKAEIRKLKREDAEINRAILLIKAKLGIEGGEKEPSETIHATPARREGELAWVKVAKLEKIDLKWLTKRIEKGEIDALYQRADDIEKMPKNETAQALIEFVSSEKGNKFKQYVDGQTSGAYMRLALFLGGAAKGSKVSTENLDALVKGLNEYFAQNGSSAFGDELYAIRSFGEISRAVIGTALYARRFNAEGKEDQRIKRWEPKVEAAAPRQETDSAAPPARVVAPAAAPAVAQPKVTEELIIQNVNAGKAKEVEALLDKAEKKVVDSAFEKLYFSSIVKNDLFGKVTQGTGSILMMISAPMDEQKRKLAIGVVSTFLKTQGINIPEGMRDSSALIIEWTNFVEKNKEKAAPLRR